MSVRVGESWQARNGHRRWVSMSLGDLLFGWGVLAVFVLPFVLLWWMLLAELWIGAEALLIVVTGLLAAVVVAGHGAKLSDVTFTRLRWGLVHDRREGGTAMSVQRYRRKPKQEDREDQFAARYEPGQPLDDLTAVARMADRRAELAEAVFPSGPVLVVRWERVPDDHPSEIEYETVEPGH